MKLLKLLALLLWPALAFGQAGSYSTQILNAQPRPLAGVNVYVCSGLSTTAATISSGVATLTMASNPITAGFTQGSLIAVYGFSGADNAFNSTLTNASFSTYAITSVSPTQITYATTAGNRTASSNGFVVQQGSSSTSCLPQATTYTDATATNNFTQPYVSDGRGNFGLFAAPGVYAIQYGSGSVATALYEISIACVPANVSSGCASNISLSNPNTWSALQSFSAGITSSGPNTLNGTSNITGSTTIPNPCAIDGVLYVSQSGCYSTFSAALTQCKSQGSCIIDARGASLVTTIGTFDPNINSTTNATVTLLLGPYNYSVTQIVLRSNLHVIGSGDGTPGSNAGTFLTQASASTPPIALPTSGTSAVTVAQGVLLSSFVLAPAASSSTDGISLVAAGCGVGCAGGGLWYSAFDHLWIGQGFGRNEIRIDGTQCDKCSAIQFDSFRDIWAFRNANAPAVLLITGSYLGQSTFDACEFDVAFNQTDTNSNLVNVQIDDTPGLGTQTFVPYTIAFINTTFQFAKATGGVGLALKGAQGVDCIACHFEQDSTIISLVTGPGGHGNYGIVVEGSFIDGFSGSGGLINIDGNSSLFFHNNSEGTNPPPGGTLTGSSVPTFLDWGGNGNNVGGASFSPIAEPTLTIAQLPPVSLAVGIKRMVSDSTAIATEGQTCTHAASSPVTAIAISNGSVWKCF